MQSTRSVRSTTKDRSCGRANFLALLLGVIMASLTLSVRSLGALSEFPIIPDPGRVLIVLLFPGMLLSAILSDNAHAWHMWVAAVINGVIYFVLGLIGIRATASLVNRRRRTRR